MVVYLAGTVKRQALDAPELLLMMRTLRDMNLSKLIAEDVPPPPLSLDVRYTTKAVRYTTKGVR